MGLSERGGPLLYASVTKPCEPTLVSELWHNMGL